MDGTYRVVTIDILRAKEVILFRRRDFKVWTDKWNSDFETLASRPYGQGPPSAKVCGLALLVCIHEGAALIVRA